MMSRHSTFLILAATTLLAAPARALVPASPQQTGSGSAGGATSVRSSCANCRSRNEDRYREKLLLQIDSLRWQIENRRLTDDERRRAVSELNATIRALQQSLDESARGTAVTATVVEIPAQGALAPSVAIARMPMRARGYLGVTFDGPSAEIQRPGDYSVRFYKYPRIALVEPSSPAERAGVLQGDTLMSFNGTDVVENEISLTKLLVPDAKVVVRVRREGNNKDLKVTIGEPPEYYVRRRQPTAVARGVPGLVEVPAQVRVGAVAPAAPSPEWGPVIPWVEQDGVGGARVETISEGLGKAIGVDEGVLVMRVRPGTIAAKAGLRDGDVIKRAAGQRIRTVADLRSVIASQGDGDEGVKLLILRERKERDVTLRW
jgi:S1-C subfamily serine protease